METRIFSISTQSELIDRNSTSVRYSAAYSNLSQYLVSVVSFKAMLSLEIKSGLLCACCASAVFAPMLVRNEVIVWKAYILFSYFEDAYII